ncbi:MAG: LytR C-terminal domain-containing protein [Solirubrobacterales bacterium]
MGELKDILLNFGAIAGFAGIIGLAVLAMLYFSQARDVKRLREWAGREPERAAEVELRAQQIASQAIAQAYESMAYRQSEAQAAAGIAEDAGTTPSPAIVAESEPPAEAPAVPEHDPGATQAHDVIGEEFGGEAAEQAPEEHHVVAESAAVGETAIQPAPDSEDEPAAETEEPAAEPEGEAEANRLSPSTPAAARSAGPLPPLPPLDTSEFTAVRAPSTPPIPDYYLSTGTTGSGTFEAIDQAPEHKSRVPFAVAGVLVAVFAVILIATQLLGGDDTTTTKGTGGSAANRQQANTSNDRNTRINRAAVTVSVLNGTSTAGLAASAATGLNKAGFTDTTTGNLPDANNQAETVVYYAAGSKPEAQEVATELAVKTLKPATEEILAQGGSVPVIVVLGADFQQQ